MSKVQVPQKKSRVGLIAFVVLVLSIIVFWVIPARMGPRKVQVEFESSQQKK